MGLFATKKLLLPFAFLSAISLTSATFADLSLNQDNSYVSYVSIKNQSIAEQNNFSRLSGNISEDGKVDIKIAMDSVQTKVDIRNERVKEHLFKVSQYPNALISAQVSPKDFYLMDVGSIKLIDLAMTVEAIGQSKVINSTVTVTRLSEDDFLVANRDIIIVNTNDFDKTGGIEKLKEIAGLSSIEPIVPLSFQLHFQK